MRGCRFAEVWELFLAKWSYFPKWISMQFLAEVLCSGSPYERLMWPHPIIYYFCCLHSTNSVYVWHFKWDKDWRRVHGLWRLQLKIQQRGTRREDGDKYAIILVPWQFQRPRRKNKKRETGFGGGEQGAIAYVLRVAIPSSQGGQEIPFKGKNSAMYTLSGIQRYVETT